MNNNGVTIHKKICPICSTGNEFIINTFNDMIIAKKSDDEIIDKFSEAIIVLDYRDIKEHKKYILELLNTVQINKILESPAKYTEFLTPIVTGSRTTEEYSHIKSLTDIIIFITTKTLPAILSTCSNPYIDSSLLAKHALSAERMTNILLKLNEVAKGKSWSEYIEGEVKTNEDNPGDSDGTTQELQEIFGRALDNTVEQDKKDMAQADE